jgi:hypothetical protein
MFEIFKGKTRKVDEFEMPLTMRQRLMSDNGWTSYECHNYIMEYKKFMILASEHESIPSLNVDKVWHEHILHTKSYESFCKIFGKFIHHNPTESVNVEKFNETNQRYVNTDFSTFSSYTPTNVDSISTDGGIFVGGEFGGSGAGADFGSSSCSSSCGSSSCGSSCGSGGD